MLSLRGKLQDRRDVLATTRRKEMKKRKRESWGLSTWSKIAGKFSNGGQQAASWQRAGRVPVNT